MLLSTTLLTPLPMSSVSEITALFTQLASHLQTNPYSSSSTNPQAPLLPLISSLNQSLNLNEDQSRVRVLNRALSLMCFKAPQVFDEEIKCLVDTIVSVLSSSVSCEVLRFKKEEFLRIGSLISSCDCVKLIETVLNISTKLEGYGTLKKLLLRSVLRVAVSASCYQGLFPLAPILRLEPKYGKSTCVSELQDIFCEDISLGDREIPLRLFLWDLDPLTLKNDISNVLREFVERPFIDLKKELHDRMTWRSIIVCLVLSPIKFIETRTLLHNWFLTTGLAFILELQIRLVSSVLDALVQPMQWSMTVEVGQKLPFPDAYLPNDDLVATLMGPISGESFLGLVHIRGPVFLNEKNTHPTCEENSTWTKLIDHNSTWATLMAFPEWFFFASVLLFSKEDSQSIFWERCISGTVETFQKHDAEQYRAAAARYLSYVISPMSVAHSDLLVKYMIQISDSWTLKQYSSRMQNATSGCNKNLRKTKLRDNKKDSRVGQENGQSLRLWLNEFNDCYMRYWTDTVNSYISRKAKTKSNYILQQSLLFRKIPLGIFIGCSNLDEEGYELLLHYAATGEIFESAETGDVHLKHGIQKTKWTDDSVAGACLVFDLCGVLEDMSTSIFETDESRLNFICQSKIKAVGFIVKCIRKLLQVTIDEGCKMSMLVDLHRRLKDWSSQGGDVLQSLKPIKDVLTALSSKIHSQ